MTLVEFIKARLDEDEAAAQAAIGQRWESMTEETLDGENIFYTVEDTTAGRGAMIVEVTDTDAGGRAVAEHVARHDPARVLADVEAMRRMIQYDGPFCTCSDADDPPMDPDTGWTTPLEHHLDCGAYEVAKLLALPCADHPDYRDEWMP